MADVHFTLSAPQRRVIVALKRRGEATADELAIDLDISASAVRQHLSGLRSAGFIASRQERGQTGRPADRYHATDLTEPLFAPPDHSLSLQLLEHLEEEDPDLVGRVFQRRHQRLVEEANDQLAGTTIGERVAAVTELLEAQGYLADSETLNDQRHRINLHSCALWTVAARFREACGAELDFISDLLPDADVERVTHKTDGAHTCSYEITVRH